MPNSWRHVDSHVADTIDNKLETKGLVVDSKPAAFKKPLKAAGQYKFPLASNQSNRTPPRPCHHCGSPLHYDHECASWKQQNRPEVKNQPASKANEVYHKSYVVMLEDDDDDFNKHCATFHALLDTDQTIESYVMEYACDEVKVSKTSGETEAHILLATERTLSENQDETTWAALPVNVVESED